MSPQTTSQTTSTLPEDSAPETTVPQLETLVCWNHDGTSKVQYFPWDGGLFKIHEDPETREFSKEPLTASELWNAWHLFNPARNNGASCNKTPLRQKIWKAADTAMKDFEAQHAEELMELAASLPEGKSEFDRKSALLWELVESLPGDTVATGLECS